MLWVGIQLEHYQLWRVGRTSSSESFGTSALLVYPNPGPLWPQMKLGRNVWWVNFPPKWNNKHLLLNLQELMVVAFPLEPGQPGTARAFSGASFGTLASFDYPLKSFNEYTGKTPSLFANFFELFYYPVWSEVFVHEAFFKCWRKKRKNGTFSLHLKSVRYRRGDIRAAVKHSFFSAWAGLGRNR